jgi:hypothetical protein
MDSVFRAAWPQPLSSFTTNMVRKVGLGEFGLASQAWRRVGLSSQAGGSRTAESKLG